MQRYTGWEYYTPCIGKQNIKKMTKSSEQLNIRNRNISNINKWILKEGYQVITHHENGLTVLGLYKPAASKNDIPEFLKDLCRGNNPVINTYVQGMHDALNLCK